MNYKLLLFTPLCLSFSISLACAQSAKNYAKRTSQSDISLTSYFDRAAFKVTDGKSEAIVVPTLGRIMRYGKIGGPNILWNSPTSAGLNWGWINYGGDKNWLAPQSYWSVFHGKNGWPPDPYFDGKPHKAEVVSGGKLRMTSPLSPGTGIRFIRTIFFDEVTGELVIQQTARKERGPGVRASIWSITQIPLSDAVFVPINPFSPYNENFFYLGANRFQPVRKVNSSLLCVSPDPSVKGGWKIGADSPVSRVISVKNGVAFLVRSPLPKGQYPDGANGAGFPIEIYINGHANPAARYIEIELLGPLQNYSVGTSFTHTMRWSLHKMPSGDIKSPHLADAVNTLLTLP